MDTSKGYSPNLLILPPNLIEKAKEVLFAKTIKEIGNYILVEYKGKRKWRRISYRSLDYLCRDYRICLRVEGYYRDFYFSTRAMEKRGYPDMMLWEQLPGQIKKYLRGGLG